MKRYFAPNLQIKGRIARGFVSVIFLLAAVVIFPLSVLLGVLLLVSGLFALFEALRGWCVLRACGIKIKI
jgi:archaellum biogenesis protein FlaJ (TadC family)